MSLHSVNFDFFPEKKQKNQNVFITVETWAEGMGVDKGPRGNWKFEIEHLAGRAFQGRLTFRSHMKMLEITL